MKKEIKKIIWESETKNEKYASFVMGGILIIIFVVLFLIDIGSVSSIIGLIMASLFILLFFFSARKKYISIYSEGLWTGNFRSGDVINNLFSSTQENVFLKWNDIEKIKIIDMSIKISYFFLKSPTIVIFTKNKRRFEAIGSSKGFVDTLKKLNKDHLLSKDSKYR